MAQGQKPLGQLLKEMELVTEGQIQEALAMQRQKGGAIGDILINLGYINREELLLALGAQMGMDVVNLEELELTDDVLDRVPATVAKAYNIVPISFENNLLTVAMANPHDIAVLDELRYMTHCEVKGAVAGEESVGAALEKYYAHKTESLAHVLG